MADEEDWLLRPALEGLCGYESLVDGTLSLLDVVVMNEALDVREENTYRISQARRTGS